MQLNERARKVAAAKLPGEQIVALVHALTHNRVSQSGTGAVQRSVLALPYFVERELNLDHPGCLHLLHGTWLAVTERRLVFFKANTITLRPKPGDELAEAALGTSTLTWWDEDHRWRLFHIAFDNGTWIGQATARGTGGNMKKPLAEADLLVQAWGDRAVQLTQ